MVLPFRGFFFQFSFLPLTLGHDYKFTDLSCETGIHFFNLSTNVFGGLSASRQKLHKITCPDDIPKILGSYSQVDIQTYE